MTLKEYQNLDQLNDHLLSSVCQGMSPEQAALLKSKWTQIREIAAQNAGHRSWGEHLLRLDAQGLQTLEYIFKDTIQSVEGKDLGLARSFVKKHPELVGLRLLLDHHTRLNSLPLNKESASALFLEYNPALVAQHRSQFQELFKFLSTQPIWLQRDVLVSQMLIGNLIALLPYFDFEDGSHLSILRLLGEKWKLVSYRVTHIPLVDHKIIAYGLEPQDEPQANPLLIFRGTPYPAASGFFDAVFSDLHPTKSIGEDIFEKGKPQLDRWMEGKDKVECYGVSLGGALAYHAGHAYGSKVEVHAYGAPGLVPMKGGMKQIHGQVFFHYADLIRLIGFHPESDHFQIYALLTEQDVDFVLAHTRPPGIGPTLVLKVNPRYENRTLSRYLFNIVKVFISTLLFLVLFPIRLGRQARERAQKLWKKFRMWPQEL